MWANPGTICACRASFGRSGLSISHVWVDLICEPSGRLIRIGFLVGKTLITGAPGTIKFPVAPASATAWSMGILMLAARKAVSVPIRSLVVLSVTIVSSSSSSHSVANTVNGLLLLFFVVGVGTLS